MSARVIWGPSGAVGNWAKEWLRKPPWVKCPKCGQYGRLYVLKIKRTGVILLNPSFSMALAGALLRG